MSDVATFLTVALGVLVAILYPILYGFIKQEFPRTAAPGLPPWVKKYAALLLFSLLTSLVALAIYRNANPDSELSFWGAFAIGLGWESTVEKLLKPNPSS